MPPSEPAKRQRDVVLEISQKFFEKKEAVTLEEIKKAAASVYVKHDKTMKAFTRDFNILVKGDFIEQNDSGYFPKFAPIFQRRPFSK